MTRCFFAKSVKGKITNIKRKCDSEQKNIPETNVSGMFYTSPSRTRTWKK